MKVDEVADRLGCKKMRGREWHIMGCSAPTGNGLYEGLDLLSNSLANKKSKN
jgi:hypothetical protein